MYNFESMKERFEQMTDEEIMEEFCKVEGKYSSYMQSEEPTAEQEEEFPEIDNALLFLAVYLAGKYCMQNGKGNLQLPKWLK